MKNNLNLIVMLTWNDQTVKNAREVFAECAASKAIYWGFKEKPLSLQKMKQLNADMKKYGKTTVLEVVAYSEQESLAGAKKAAECGLDILMGTRFYDSVNAFCKEQNIRYMPYVGNVSGRPSVLEGDIQAMIEEAKEYLAKGVYGINLLGYRYKGNADALVQKFTEAIDAPICVAGSINSMQRLDLLKKCDPWAFTIGSAFFENKFGDSFSEQINTVCDYLTDEK